MNRLRDIILWFAVRRAVGDGGAGRYRGRGSVPGVEQDGGGETGLGG